MSRAAKEGRRLFRAGKESELSRIRKKTTGKTSWYRKKKSTEDTDNKKAREVPQVQKRLDNRKRDARNIPEKSKKELRLRDNKDLDTAAVLFVDNTKDGGLASKLRGILERIQGILGYKIKIVERSGNPLKLLFALSRIGEGGECGREDCVPCTLPPCRKRNILYENICTLFNPGVGGDNKDSKLSPPDHPPSIYVGESSRSLYERGREHWEAFKNKSEDSHIY